MRDRGVEGFVERMGRHLAPEIAERLGIPVPTGRPPRPPSTAPVIGGAKTRWARLQPLEVADCIWDATWRAGLPTQTKFTEFRTAAAAALDEAGICSFTRCTEEEKRRRRASGLER